MSRNAGTRRTAKIQTFEVFETSKVGERNRASPGCWPKQPGMLRKGLRKMKKDPFFLVAQVGSESKPMDLRGMPKTLFRVGALTTSVDFDGPKRFGPF